MSDVSPLHVRISMPPWQGLLFDAERILDLACGQLGATGVTLAVKAPEPSDAVALDAAGEPVGLRVAPGAIFQPNLEQYASTRIRPVTSPTLKSRNPAARLATLCADRSLEWRLRLSALRDAAVAARHPDAATCNALGLTSPDHLCASNPDVVEFVRCQLLDLAGQFAPHLIEVANFLWPDGPAGGQAVSSSPAPGPVESALLGLCFCPSCRQMAVQAGVDATSALRSVLVRLRRWLRDERPDARPLAELLQEDEILAGYVACQHDALAGALRVWARCVSNLSLRVAPDRNAAPDSPLAGAPPNPSLQELAALSPRLTLRIEPLDPDVSRGTGEPLLAPDVSRGAGLGAQQGAARAAILEVAIDALAPAFAAGPAIVRYLTDLARAGVGSIDLENALGASPARWPFLKQAIRAARRERGL